MIVRSVGIALLLSLSGGAKGAGILDDQIKGILSDSPKAEVTLPRILPPPQQEQQPGPLGPAPAPARDPRCDQLTEAQRQQTPGCQ
jgi:hypothetical protein